jgi:NTE family protein
MNAAAPPKYPARPAGKRIALVLQGGGALGAYQAGVFQALVEHDYCPDWVAGTSIGSINGGIIAGNAVEKRLERLEEFWKSVSREDFWDIAGTTDVAREIFSHLSVMNAILAGQPGFFIPRPLNLLKMFPFGSVETASYYDTSPLRGTLERLIDFDLINSGATRLSLGAINVTTGVLRYFDSKRDRIRPEHIMASCALPPGFPAVRVENDLYWDGGIYSNTPLDVVLDNMPRVDTLCFMIALFDPKGPEPRSIPEVETRHKDIVYSTRALEHVQTFWRIHNLRRTVRSLFALLPQELKEDPEVQEMADLGCHTTMHIVQIIYPARNWELAFKDADFSWTSIRERWDCGYRDATRTLKWAPWEKPVPKNMGVMVHTLRPEEPDDEGGGDREHLEEYADY